MTRSFSIGVAGLALVGIMASGAPATAQPANLEASDEATSVTVSYRDLDISQTAGAKTLLWRIKAAAATICGGPPDPRLLDELAAFERCSDALVAKAVGKVNSPALTALAEPELGRARIARR